MKAASALPAVAIAATIVGLLSACGGSPTNPITITTPPTVQPTPVPLTSGGATSVYVVEGSSTGINNSILQFPIIPNGSQTETPSSMLQPPSAMTVSSVTTDSLGQIYVGGSLPGAVYEVLVYAAGASGSATPVRTVVTSISPTSMTVGTSGLLYIVSSSSATVAVYPATANGAATPLGLIAGSNTQLTDPAGIAVDAYGDMYVTDIYSNGSNNGYITVYLAGTTGNVSPARSIFPTAGLGTSLFFGIALDPGGNIYTVENVAGISVGASGSGVTSSFIAEYAASANGTASPIKTITSTALINAKGLRMDSAGNIYVVNTAASGTVAQPTTAYSVLGFGAASSGNVTPPVNFNSASWNVGDSELALK